MVSTNTPRYSERPVRCLNGRARMMINILICTYNHGHFLKAALDSCRSQTLAKAYFKIIVVDDGSTDNTREIVKSIIPLFTIGQAQRFSRLRYIRHERNRGLPVALNTGLRAIKTKYFMRLDADDRLHPDILNRMLNRIYGDDDAALVFSDRIDVCGGDRKYVDLSRLPHDYPECLDRTIDHLTSGGILFRTGYAKRIGGFRDMFWEEHDFLNRYLRRWKRPMVHIPEALYYSVRRPESMTHGLGTKAEWEAQSITPLS